MTKLSISNGITILLLCTLIFGVSFGITQYNEAREISTIVDGKTEGDLDYILQGINLELGQAEQVAKTFAAAVFRNGTSIPCPEDIYQHEEMFLAANPSISSIQVGFEDRVFPQYADSGGFGPIVVRTPAGLSRMQLNKLPNFRQFDWYNIAIHKAERRWCRPFFSPSGHYAIATYSVPLFNENKHLVGVVGINIRLSRIDSIVSTLKPYPNAVPAILLNSDLTYIQHPIKDFVLNMNLKDELEALGEVASDEFLSNLGNRKRGHDDVSWGGENLCVYYAPVDKAECSVLLSIDPETVRRTIAPYYSYRLWLMCGGLLILALYLIVLMIKK